ncbi:MAG: 3'-5' exonuclease [Tannerella sp.]|jgi:DNA polymerase-3 subunit epsilon|nr:3'-5' exonuclease [Tannerella sp.]
MKLELKRPLVFFDLETTGTNIVSDRIVEISFLKIHPDGREECKTRRINPEMSIPAGATEIHGITDNDVRDCPTFKMLARSLAEQIEGCDLAGFNSNRFDIPILAEEFIRADVNIDLSKCNFIDVQTIFHKMEPRTLVAAYKVYCGKDLADAAHSAEGDTRATCEVLKAQLERYADLPHDVEKLSEYTSQNNIIDFAGRLVYNEAHEPVFNFGKYKEQKIKDIMLKDPKYIDWIKHGDFTRNTKQKLNEILNEE